MSGCDGRALAYHFNPTPPDEAPEEAKPEQANAQHAEHTWLWHGADVANLNRREDFIRRRGRENGFAG
jgi:hypothetical protein